MNRTLQRKSQQGFILIATLLALSILTILGTLVFVVSTQDIRISSRSLGEKKALAAAQAGVHVLLNQFDPLDKDASKVSNIQVDPATDPDSAYSISSGPDGWMSAKSSWSVPQTGVNLAGGEGWGYGRSVAISTGTNTRFNSTVRIEVSIAYGPVSITTDYR